jgi:hypothetical protein
MKDLCLYLLPWLEDTDVTAWPFVFSTIALTVVAYTLLFITVCIASFFLKKFWALGDVDKFLWCIKGTKLFYFPIPVFTGLWYLLVDDTLKDDVVNGTTRTVSVVMYILVGFYLYDTVLLVTEKLLYGNRFSTSLLIHHFVVLITYSIGTYYNMKGQYFYIIGFLEEIVGPLSYVNWMLAKAKLTHLSIMKVNQRITVYLWHFRTILELYYFYTIIKNWSYVWNELPTPQLITCSLITALIAFVLTPQWTKVEAKRLYRQYSRKISFSVKHQEMNVNKTSKSLQSKQADSLTYLSLCIILIG